MERARVPLSRSRRAGSPTTGRSTVRGTGGVVVAALIAAALAIAPGIGLGSGDVAQAAADTGDTSGSGSNSSGSNASGSTPSGDSAGSSDSSVAASDPMSTGSLPTATGADGRVGIAAVLPLTVPVGSDGLLSSDDLADLTANDGLLTRELDVVSGRPIAVAIDPRLIASIRVLGGSAPASAKSWLLRLASLDNETFALRYADADPVGPGQAGSASALGPLGFDFAIDADRFADPLPSASSSPSGSTGSGSDAGSGADSGGSGSSTGDTTAGSGGSTKPNGGASTPAGQLPALPTTVDQVVQWTYSLPTIAWPGENTVTAADLPRLQAAGDSAVLLSDENVDADGATHVSFDGSQVGGLVIDSGLSAAVRAAGSTSQSDYTVVDQELQSAAAEGGSAVRIVALARPSTGSGADADARAEALDAAVSHLLASPFVSAVPLSTAIAEDPTAATVIDHPEDAARTASIAALLDVEQQVSAFAVVARDGALAISAPRRLDLLATLSVGWISSRSWASTVSDYQKTSSEILDGVTLNQGSDLIALGASAPLPMQVQNSLDVPIVVFARARPLSPVLSIESSAQPVRVEVAPKSSATVRIPAQAITNGSVQVVLSLSATDGTQVGQARRIHVEVQAGWETVGTAVIAIGAVGVFGFGIVRNILKRRRRLAGEVDEEDAANAPLPGQEDGPVEVVRDADAGEAGEPSAPLVDDPADADATAGDSSVSPDSDDDPIDPKAKDD
ncbi:hypothetical protein GCM10027515_08010 [Schumannella luteola]|uniref:2-oxoglutarate dehydrogenase n=1 Tax=Schumannella luteola TaxID=472059 RepID=A0A852YJZ6_9MICO|nr:DUF6049 family protein [Schumannella luteola]NYG98069.1 hypothetical protein [Schumannella luteola]